MWSIKLVVASVILTGCGGSSVIPPVAHQVPTTLTLTANDPSPMVGVSTSFSVVVTPAATGSVSLVDGSNTNPAFPAPTPLVSGILASGMATLTLKPQSAGLTTYVASYAGDTSYDPSAASLQISVRTPASSANCGIGDAVSIFSSGSSSPAQTSFTSTAADQSAVCAQNAGTALKLVSPIITKSGGNFYELQDASGVDSAVLAYGNSATIRSGATISLQGSPSISVQSGGYAAFASGFGSTLTLENAVVTSTNSQYAFGAGNNGQINITNSSLTSGYDLMAIVNGGSAVLTDTSLTSTYGGPTFGTAQAGQIYLVGPVSGSPVTTTFRMVGGAITTNATAFNVSGNQNATIYLSGVNLKGFTDDSGSFLSGAANVGSVALILDNEAVVGNVEGSSLQLQNGSTLKGDYSGGGSLTLDASSSMTLHSSGLRITVFNDPGGISGTQVTNIHGSGQTLGYSNSLNPQLGGLTYTLSGGGTLIPY